MTLADLGAAVLRIVSGSRPDPADMMPPCIVGMNLSLAMGMLGREKRCPALILYESSWKRQSSRSPITQARPRLLDEPSGGITGSRR
jgi:hypothetical protein